MLKIILGFFGLRKAPVQEKVVQPWEGGGARTFVAFFKSELDLVAEALSGSMRSIAVRFNAKEQCAEFFDQEEKILAQVIVYGERGIPHKIYVRTVLAFDERQIFTQYLPKELSILFLGSK